MLVNLFKNKNISIRHFEENQPANPENKSFIAITPVSIPSFKNYRAYANITFGNLPKIQLEETVKRITGKNFHGRALFDDETGNFIIWQNVGWKNLKQEPINWLTATGDEITAFWHAVALGEVKDNPWVRRYNYLNVPTPLAVHHTSAGITAKRYSRDNIEALKALEKIPEGASEAQREKALRASNYQNAKERGLSFAQDYQSEESRRLQELSAVEAIEFNKKLSRQVINPQTGKLGFNFTVFDTETTGIQLYPTKRPALLKGVQAEEDCPVDVIVQLGAVKYNQERGLMPESALRQLVNPQRHIPEGATAVHHITDEMIESAKAKGKAPTLATILSPFIRHYIGTDILVAYNSKFDITLINNAIEQNRSTANGLKKKSLSLTLDPFVLIQRIHPFVGAKKTLAEQYKFLFGQDLEGAHDAYADVKGTYDVLKYCIYYLQSKSTRPLTVRDILKFQHGGIVEGLGINLDNYTGCDAAKKFKNSYRAVNVSVQGLPLGYSISDNPKQRTLAKLHPLIGAENYEIIDLAKKYLVNRSTPYSNEQTYREVLSTYIQPYDGKSQNEIIDIIVQHSLIVDDVSKNLWMKNLNIHDIEEGNDLPDIDVARKVMLERIEEDKKFQNVTQKDVRTAIRLLSTKISTTSGQID